MSISPLISFLIPTFNSERTLVKTLDSIIGQTYPQGRIEILVVDGGSTDATVSIAKKYGCTVLPNPKTDIMEAEAIGYSKARGKYMVFLAPDEVLENPNSLNLKRAAIDSNSLIKAVLPTGYKTPKDYSPINHYINEFGDPFSYFMYRESKGYKFLINDLANNYTKVSENDDWVVFSFIRARHLPLIELWAGGCMIDLQYTKKNFPQVAKHPHLIPLIFYLLNRNGKQISVTKNDPTTHYSSSSFSKYLKKIRSRVEFNIFLTPMGKGGFSGREHFDQSYSEYRKYLFIPYSFSLILPILDSIALTYTRKQSIYLLHPFLCLYTSLLIIYYYLMKIFGMKHTIKLYGH